MVKRIDGLLGCASPEAAIGGLPATTRSPAGNPAVADHRRSAGFRLRFDPLGEVADDLLRVAHCLRVAAREARRQSHPGHPGNGDPAETSFPLEFHGKTIPRDATVAIMRKDGGIVGF